MKIEYAGKSEIEFLELHKKIKIDRNTEVMRVHSGWIYLHYDLINLNWLKATTFVPRLMT